jgi:hypothetical protein
MEPGAHIEELVRIAAARRVVVLLGLGLLRDLLLIRPDKTWVRTFTFLKTMVGGDTHDG